MNQINTIKTMLTEQGYYSPEDEADPTGVTRRMKHLSKRRSSPFSCSGWLATSKAWSSGNSHLLTYPPKI